MDCRWTKFVLNSSVVMLTLCIGIAVADEGFDKLFAAGKYKDAIDYADEKIAVGDRDAAIWSKLGTAHEEQELFEKALACYMVGIRIDQKNYEAQLGAARIYFKMGQPETALEMAKKAIELKPTGEASWVYAQACIALNKTVDAKSALEKVVEGDPANVVASRALGELFYKEKNYVKALPLLKVALAAHPDGETALSIATAFKTMGKVDSAALYYKEASRDRKSPKPEAFLELGRIYFQQEKFKECAEEYQQVDSKMLNGQDFFQWAVSLEKAGQDKAKVAQAYRSAIGKYGNAATKESIIAKEKVGRYDIERKDYKAALVDLEDLRKTVGDAKVSPEILFLIAEAYDGLKQGSQAIPILEMVVARDKENVEAYARLADLYTKEKMAEKANDIYSRLLTLQPNSPKVYLALGDYNFKAKKYDEALKHFQKSYTLDQQSAAAIGMMRAAWELKRYDLARDAAETALHTDEKLREPQIVLAKIFIQEKNYSNAQKMLEQLLKDDPKNMEQLENLAVCYQQAGNSAKLAEIDKKIIDIDSKNIVSRQRYATFLQNAGNFKEAAAVLSELAKLQPKEADVFMRLFEVSLKIDAQNDALSYLKTYVDLRPKDAAAQKKLGDLLYEKKDNSGALKAYKAALQSDPSIKGFYKRYADLIQSQPVSKTPLAKGELSREEVVVEALSSAVKAGEADAEIFATLGEMYKKQESYPKAIEMFEKALQKNPKDFASLSSLAYCQEKAGKISEAIITYEQAVALNEGDTAGIKALGDLYLKAGKKDQAVTMYKKYLERKPDSKMAQLTGDYEYDRKKYADAAKYYALVSGEAAHNPDFLVRYGNAAFQNNDIKKAEEIFRNLIVQAPKNPEPFKVLYEITLKAGKKQEAADFLQKYTMLHSGDVVSLTALGNLYYELKKSTEAIGAYREALKIDPKTKGFYKQYLELVLAGGTAEEKLAALNGAVMAGEADASVYSQLGNIYMKSENYVKALQQFEKATQLNPKDVSLLTSLAFCQDKTGSIDAAILTYEQAVAMNPAADKEYKLLGDLYTKQKKNENALRSYKKYLEKNSDNAIAVMIGDGALAKKDFAEAIKYYAMVKGTDDQKPEYLLNYGQACFQLKNDAKAVELLTKLTSLTSTNPDVYNTLYEIALRGGDKAAALANLRKYVALKPGDAQAQKTLGDMLYENKDRVGAANAYRSALKADPKAKGFYKRYAELVMDGGNDEDVLLALTGAIASGEADVDMYTKIGGIYNKLKKYDKAIEMYEKASQLDPKNGRLLTQLGSAQASNGNSAAAILTYEQAVAMSPDASNEYKVLGDLYSQQKKTDLAIKNYMKYLEKNSDNVLARMVGSYAMDKKNYVDAVKYLGMVRGADADKPDFIALYADACYQAKSDDQAYLLYKKLASTDTQNSSVFNKLYTLAERVGTKDEVLLYLKKFTALKSSDADAQKKLGDILYERKDTAGALLAYRAVIKANPQVKGFYKRYAELVLAGGKDDEIVPALTGAIAAGEADVGMYVRLGEYYKKAGDFKSAVAMYEKASQLDPKSSSYLTELAAAQAKSGNSSAAVLTYEQAIAMNPSSIDEYRALGDLYKVQGKLDLAIKNYKKFLEKKNDNGLAQEVGENAFKKKEYAEAVKYLGMVSGADSASVSFLKTYAEAAFLANDYPKAFGLYKQLSTVLPKDANILYKLYEISQKAGTKDDQLVYLKRYTALNTNDANSFKTLGDILYGRNDSLGALNAYRAALKADPNVKWMFKKFASLVLASGKDDEIVTVLKAAIAANEADVDIYTKLGEIYNRQKDYMSAIAMYEKASQLDPKNPLLLNNLAQVQAKAGKNDAAILTFEQAIAMNPKAEKEYKELGDLYLAQKKVESALKAYKKYLEKSQDNTIAKLVGSEAYKKKNYKDAMDYLGMVTGSEASDSTHLMLYGEACLSAKDDFKAFQIFKQLSNVTPKDPVVFEKLYTLAGKAGTKDDVLDYLKKYTQLKPTDAKAQKELGDILYEKKDEDGALAAYRAAYKADSNLKGFYKNYASIVTSKGSDVEKEQAFKGAIAAGEADAKMYQGLGDIYTKKGKDNEAIKAYEKAVQLDPKNDRVLIALAQSQEKNGSISDAILSYEQVVALNPRADTELKALGNLYLKQKKTEPAISAFKKYLAKKPDDYEIAEIVGEAALNSKNYTEAVKYFGMVTGSAAKRAPFLTMYSEASFAAEDYPRTQMLLKDLVTLTPKDANVYKQLYAVNLKMGAKDEALSNLKTYTAFMPKNAGAQKDLGNMLFEKHDDVGALKAYRAAITADAKITGLYKNYVTLVLKAGTPNEKMSALNGCIAAGEADADVYRTLGEIYSGSKNYPKAMEMYEKAAKLDPKDGTLLSSLATCQLKAGLFKEATMTLEQALAMNPNAVVEYKQLGELYMKQKKTSAAITSFRKYLDKAPKDQEIAALVAQYYFDAKNYKDAYKYFSMNKESTDLGFLLNWGICALNIEAYTDAITILEKIRDQKTKPFDKRDVAYKSLSKAYSMSGDPKKAIDVLNDYVKIPGVHDPDASYQIAEVYEAVDPQKAVEMYQANAVAYTKDYRNFLKLGIYYARQKNSATTAVKYLERCAVLNDTISRVWLELGTLYSRLKRDDDMLRVYRKFIEVDPGNAEASAKIGEILLSKNMVQDAMVFLEMANSQKENDPKLMTLLARGYLMTDRRNEGAELLEKVIKMTKGNVDDELRMVLADVYLEGRQYSKAIKELKTLLDHKEDVEVMLKYSQALFEDGKYSEASKVVEQLKGKQPENIENQMMLGKIQVAQKKYNDAIETYKQILYIDQNYAPALCERANVYLIQDKRQWAQTFYDRALKADPKCALAYLGIARLAKKAKDYAGYSDNLEKASKLDPRDKDIIEEMKSTKR